MKAVGGIAGGVIFKAACFDVSVKNRSGAERGSGCICADFCLWSETGSLDAHRGCWLQSRWAELSLCPFFPQHLKHGQKYHQDYIESNIFQVMYIWKEWNRVSWPLTLKTEFTGPNHYFNSKPFTCFIITHFCFKMLSCTCTHLLDLLYHLLIKFDLRVVNVHLCVWF